MLIPSVKKLNQDFLLNDGKQRVEFKTGKNAIPVVEIENEQASASFSLQGAHLLSWFPRGEAEVIWLSEQANYAVGKSIRGGIPICWPWFGAHAKEASFPAHGFARTVMWQVKEIKSLVNGETQIVFVLDTEKIAANIQTMWPHSTLLEFRVSIGKTLSLELHTFNRSEQPISIGQALHTYFAVRDVRQTSVLGLQDKDYLDKTDGFARKKQTGPVLVNSEVDRVYLQSPDDVIINNEARKLRIKKQGSRTTIVWNPWKDVAEKMGDLGRDGYLKMLCVESANAADDCIDIEPGESHTLTVKYMLE